MSISVEWRDCHDGGGGGGRWVAIVHRNEDNVNECERQNQRQQQTEDVGGVALVHPQEVSLVEHFHLQGKYGGKHGKKIQLVGVSKDCIYTL